MNFLDDKKIKVTRFVIEEWTADDHRNAAENLQLHAALPLDAITGEEPNLGWANGRAELNLDLADCMVADNIFASMRIAVRKIPAGIANALYRKKAEEYKKNHNTDFIGRKAKREIEEEVKETLLPRTMPTVKSAWVVVTPNGVAYLGSVANKDKEFFRQLFYDTFKKELAERNIAGIVPECFIEKAHLDADADLEFLTDLFRQTEEQNDVNFAVFAPFDLVSPDGEGLCTRALADGDCAKSSEEVRIALKGKKLLKKLRMSVVPVFGYGEHDVFEFTLTRDLGMSGLKTPEGEEQEFAARFVEKLGMVADIFTWIDGAVLDFADRASKPDYPDKVRTWIATR